MQSLIAQKTFRESAEGGCKRAAGRIKALCPKQKLLSGFNSLFLAAVNRWFWMTKDTLIELLKFPCKRPSCTAL